MMGTVLVNPRFPARCAFKVSMEGAIALGLILGGSVTFAICSFKEGFSGSGGGGE